MKQYNGFYGCTFCYHPGTSINNQRKYTIDENVPALRTHDEIKTAMENSRKLNRETNKIEELEIRGVKGPSVLMRLNYFDMAKGMTVESMHALYSGTMEKYTECILTHVGKPYYVGSPDKLALINQRLMSIKVPGVITRQPRPIEMRSLWKASEWRSWSQLHCLLCLDGILPDEYLFTWLNLS